MVDYYSPIPKCEFPQQSKFIEPCNERLVTLEASDKFDLDLQYFKQEITGSIKECLVRETVLDMLCAAQQLLPKGYKIKIFDAWRPIGVQKSLFYNYYDMLKIRYPTDTETELINKTSCFVSFPSEDIMHPFVHSTGGAVDLTLVDASGHDLDMGTGFDAFTDLSYTCFFETDNNCNDNTIIKNNRRMLYNTMLAAGFTNLPSEWWHYDYGTHFWATIKSKPAIYTGIIK